MKQGFIESNFHDYLKWFYKHLTNYQTPEHFLWTGSFLTRPTQNLIALYPTKGIVLAWSING